MAATASQLQGKQDDLQVPDLTGQARSGQRSAASPVVGAFRLLLGDDRLLLADLSLLHQLHGHSWVGADHKDEVRLG